MLKQFTIMLPRQRPSCPCVAGTEWPSSAKQEVIKAGGRENTVALEKYVTFLHSTTIYFTLCTVEPV